MKPNNFLEKLALLILFSVVSSVCAPLDLCARIALQAQSNSKVTQDSESDSERQSQELPKHAVWRFGEYGKTPNSNGIYRIVYSNDGQYLATRNQENIVAIYDSKTREKICELEPHEERVETIDFSPDNKFFVTAAGPNEKVKVWQTRTGKLDSEIDTDGKAAFFNSIGTGINVLGETHVERYSWPGVQMTDQSKWNSTNEKRIGMSRSGQYVFGYKHLNRQNYQSLLIDTDSKSKVTMGGSSALPKTAKFSPDGNWVAATYQSNFKIYLWDLRDPRKLRYVLSKHKSTAQSISFSSDSRFLVSSGWDKKVFTWDVLTRQTIGEFEGHTANVNATAFAPLGYSFASGASGTTDCSAIVWNMRSLLFKPEHKPDPNSKLSLEKQFDSIWKSLGTSSLGVSMKGTATFAQSGDLFLDVFEKKIATSISTKSSGSIDEAISLLSHPEFSKRQKATDDLIKIRLKAEPQMRAALLATESLEVRYRISMILKQKTPRPKSDLVESRRWSRSLFALEEINTERSQEILKAMAEGHVDADVSQNALQCYERNILRAELAD